MAENKLSGFTPLGDPGGFIDLHRVRCIIEDGHDPLTRAAEAQLTIARALSVRGLQEHAGDQRALRELTTAAEESAAGNVMWLGMLDECPHHTLELHYRVAKAAVKAVLV